MNLDILFEDPRWPEADLTAWADSAVSTTLNHLTLSPDIEIAILACDDTRIAALNADFRDKPTPTNVLSWPEEDLTAVTPGATPKPPLDSDLGNIAIAYDTCRREAGEQDKPFSAHVTHLLVHATLHLLGYDHIRDPDATLMERLEKEILGKLGLPDPYRDG